MTGEDPIVIGMAGRYATALFELALDAGRLPEVESDLGSLKSALDDSTDLRRFVMSPVYGREQQMAAMQKIMAKAGISELTQKFIGVVIRNRRLFALRDIITAFAGLVSRHRGEIRASVTSARALADRQMQELKTALKQAMGRDVLLTAAVDENLLGGLVVKVGSRMVDSSLATKINNIQIAMKEA